MVSSILRSAASAGLLALAAAAAGAPNEPPPAAPAPARPAEAAVRGGLQSDLPILVDARSSEFDYKKNRLLFHAVTITQGNLRVDAGEAAATGLNFDNSQWQLSGDVHIKMEKGSLSSDSADVTFVDNQISRAVINGAPANFEQTLDQPTQIARGHANVIEYDVKNGTVRLAKNAWLSDGDVELSGDILVYDIRAERVVANSPATSEGRVQIRIPRTRKPAAEPADPKQ
jgi:lipopolysaccharide transport protein LptA